MLGDRTICRRSVRELPTFPLQILAGNEVCTNEVKLSLQASRVGRWIG